MPQARRDIESPIGPLRLTADADAIVGVEFVKGGPKLPATAGEGDQWIDAAAKQLQEYFAGQRRDFDLPLAPRGTDFQKRVWLELCRIPFARTTSYGALAKAVGSPGAARAVGAANGRNPIAIVIPCHRAIGANGALVGFGGGLDVKRRLLALESTAAMDSLV